MYLLDTNVLIYYAAGSAEVREFLNINRNEVFYIPSIAIVEFLSYPLISQGVITRFKQFVDQTVILNLDFSIAELAAELRRLHKLKLADGVVAASALISNSALVTRNIRDFKKVKNLKLVAI